MLTLTLALALGTAVQAAPRPATPIMIEAGDLDPCSNGVVHGLKAAGDGFLSIRSTPSTKSRELDRLYNGADVYICAQKGDWIGIVYSQKGGNCNVTSPWPKTMAYTGPCRSGWAHRRWIELTAG
jgi:hypothetical protein